MHDLLPADCVDELSLVYSYSADVDVVASASNRGVAAGLMGNVDVVASGSMVFRHRSTVGYVDGVIGEITIGPESGGIS